MRDFALSDLNGYFANIVFHGQIMSHVAALDRMRQLQERVLEHFKCIEVIVTNLSPALAVHSGPGTVGVCFFPTGPAES